MFITILLFSSPSAAKPAVTWTPSSVTEAVLAGDTIMISVSFTASKNLSNIVVNVVPELQPLVDVNPLILGNITEGETVVLDVIISPPANSFPKAVQGTIQLRHDERGSNKTSAMPLPVTVIIEWPTTQVGSPDLTATFSYPAGWVVEEVVFQTMLFSPGAIAAIDAGNLLTPPGITLTIFNNANGLSLPEFMAELDDGWYSTYTEVLTTSINGADAIVARDVTSPIPRTPEVAAFVALDGRILLITGLSNFEDEFNVLTDSLELP